VTLSLQLSWIICNFLFAPSKKHDSLVPSWQMNEPQLIVARKICQLGGRKGKKLAPQLLSQFNLTE
jgi:hypothetical protein